MDGFWSLTKQTICTVCPAGKYCSKVAETDCPSGTYSLGMATACSYCPAGKSVQDQAVIINDPNGWTLCMDR